MAVSAIADKLNGLVLRTICSLQSPQKSRHENLPASFITGLFRLSAFKIFCTILKGLITKEEFSRLYKKFKEKKEEAANAQKRYKDFIEISVLL